MGGVRPVAEIVVGPLSREIGRHVSEPRPNSREDLGFVPAGPTGPDLFGAVRGLDALTFQGSPLPPYVDGVELGARKCRGRRCDARVIWGITNRDKRILLELRRQPDGSTAWEPHRPHCGDPASAARGPQRAGRRRW